ncbi:restriction endonuclease [Streptomyces sp. NPDC004065]|uniref:restriction endonuclease n=1 Tax=Streptomyces sp. NPDC004065 TaxID=3364689 RepID=UPI00384C94E0
MTTPARRLRAIGRRSGRRAFDLRATTVFFALLALLFVALGLTARAAAAAAERRPAWTAFLCLVAAATALTVRRGRRRHSARKAARRAAAALQEATRTALDALETECAPGPGAPQAGPAAPGADPWEAGPATAGAPEAGPVDHEALSPEEFEQAVAALCERDGCARVEVVGGAGDLGADVLAETPDGRRLVVQCKRYLGTHRVGSEELQRFGGTCYTVHGADVAILVTTGDVTAPAAEYAERCGIVCVDGPALRAWSEGSASPPWLAVPADGPPRECAGQ